jgi:hypothetical protein
VFFFVKFSQVLYGLSVAYVIKHMGALLRSAVSCYQVLAAAVIMHVGGLQKILIVVHLCNRSAGEEVSWLQLIFMIGILMPATMQLARASVAMPNSACSIPKISHTKSKYLVV